MSKNYLAIDIGGTAIKHAIVSPGYRIIGKGKCLTPYEGVGALVATLTGIAKPYLSDLAGIGISLPGTVTGDADGTVYRGGSLGYMHQVPLGKLMAEATGLACAVENDGKCCALGEYATGALKGSRIGVVIALGTGVGGGTIIDGRVLRGAHDFAGEFSFIVGEPDKLPGFESLFGFFCGTSGLKNAVIAAKELPADTELDGVSIFDMANAGDGNAIAGIRTFCRRLATQATNLQYILDPDVIALGGGISSQPLLLQLVREEVAALQARFPFRLPEPNLVLCQNGNDANLLGAVYTCIQRQTGPAGMG